jgi:Tfp pilus assembly protein PilW
MTLRSSRPTSGFTLVELLIGTSLSAAVMLGVLSSYIYLGRSFTRLANQQTLETEARRTLGYFARDAQTASGIAGTPSASAVTFILPSATGAPATVSYTFANDAGGKGTLTRTVGSGNPVTLLRNITNDGLSLRYYDAGGNEYTAFTDYLPGIKQMSLEFTTRIVTTNQGTSTAAYPVASGRLVLRNKPLLQ